MDTVLKMLLIAFISLFAFSSGVYFGKQMSDSDYQLKALEGDFHGDRKTAGHGKDAEANGEEAVQEDEVAALSDKYVNAEKGEATEGDDHKAVEHKKEEGRKVASEGEHAAAAEEHDDHAAPAHAAAANEHGAEESEEAHAAPKAAKPDLSAAHKAATRVANNAAPIEPAKPQPESRIPNSLPKTVGASSDVEFTVQVASYPTADAAKSHANELVKKGFPAFPVEASVGGRVWYRVSVGSFKTLKEATSYRAQLLKQADVQSAIVQRIQR